jgi:hypothetical protein
VSPGCRERLANFKVPRRVWIVESLPRGAVGKIAKPELRAGDHDVEALVGECVAQSLLAEHVAVDMPERRHLGHLMTARVQERDVEPARVEAGRDSRTGRTRAPPRTVRRLPVRVING